MKQMKVVLGLAPLALCAVTAIGNACHLQERQTQSGVRADYTHIVSTGPDAYGSNTWWSDQDAAVWQTRWGELRPSYLRLFISHAVIEPENDNADPENVDWSRFWFDQPISIPSVTTRTITYREWLTALRDSPGGNEHILIHFSYLSPWLSDNPPHSSAQSPIPIAPYPPNDLDEYREFVETALRFIVEVVEFPPQRVAIEAMNEPDLACGADPVTPCFWQNWEMADIADLVRVTHQAIQAVDARITLVGLAECCGTEVVRDLLDHYPEGAYLEGLSYHYYAGEYNLDVALNRATTLRPYGLPIYLDEYGSRTYLSEGVEGALWHSWALATLWQAEIAPIQYPISEWILLGEPYTQMGLFADWRGDWERKPSYWVYANFFRFFGGGAVISHTAPAGLDVLVSRRIGTGTEPGSGMGAAEAAFWVVNRTETLFADQLFTLNGFPTTGALLRMYDNLVAPTPVWTKTVSGVPLVFTATLPARSSRVFVLQADPQTNLPLTLCLPVVLRHWKRG